MFKFSQRQLFHLSISAVIITSILVFGVRLKSCLISFLSFPLKISSGFFSDAKAVLNYRAILNENIQLKKEIFGLQKDAVLMKELRQENNRLKKLLSFREQLQLNTVAARIIARDPNNWSRGVVINKGDRQGVKTGNVVITELGLVGRIMETSGSFSKIILINDTDNAVSALIQRSREEGLISGTLIGGIAMRYLEKEADVAQGDIVLTSGLTRNYPASILIGEVKEVKEEPQGLGKYAVIKPAVDLRKIEEVLVIVE